MKVIIDMIYGSAAMNNIMHAADVFEPGKQLGTYESASVIGDPNIDDLCDKIQRALVSGGQNVIFVAISDIDDKPVQAPLYLKPNVQSVSNGKEWAMFHEMLKAMDYEIETDEHMHVLSAKRII